MTYLLALDQGTSSSRSIVFDRAGRVVTMAQREFRQIYPQPGWVEHDPGDLWQTQLATAREALKQAHLRADALEAIKQVGWFPQWGEARIAGMVDGRPDWTISRQRTWGVPIALFVHRETGEPHPRSVELMRAVADKVEQGGVDVWYTLDAAELLGDEAKDYDKITDILDVWFDSGVTHEGVLAARGDLEAAVHWTWMHDDGVWIQRIHTVAIQAEVS